MNQEEMLQNMTKGEWEIANDLPENSYPEIIRPSGERIYVQGNNAENDVAAIVIAVNWWQGIILKGINTKAVGIMKEYCECQESWDEHGEFTHNGSNFKQLNTASYMIGLKYLWALRKEALTASNRKA